MPDTENHAPGLGELSRQVRDVLVRFEKLATQLENQFVRRDIWEWQKAAIERSVQQLDGDLKDIEKVAQGSLKDLKTQVETERATKDSHATLERRVGALEDNQKWLVRIVLTFVILGILAATIVFGKPGGP